MRQEPMWLCVIIGGALMWIVIITIIIWLT
jgi:hypothetical protein